MAYEWNNLFFSCQICNQRFKKNYFPIEDETKRAKNHTFDYLKEDHLLIHPSVDNPDDHIIFNRHVPVAKTEKGKTSISSFGIDRPELNRIREAHLQNVRINQAFAKIDLENITDSDRQHYSRIMQQPWPILEQLIRTAKAFMTTAADDTKPFAAMVRAHLV